MISESRTSFADVHTRLLSVDGHGPPIVLLHGYADSADTWRAVLDRLEAAGRRAIAADLPGFGHADHRTPGPILPQLDAFVDAMVATLESAVLVGNSLGAATAVRAASRHDARVIGLVALDDPLNADHLIARIARTRAIPASLWERAGRLRIPTALLQRGVGRAVPWALYGPGTMTDPQVIARWSDSVSSVADVSTLARYAFQYAYESRTAHRGLQIGCPTVIVHGARDRIIPVVSSRVLHQQIPGSALVVLPSSGHCPQLDNPDEVARLIGTLHDEVSGHSAHRGV
ncbi:alpha/beta hydrolase [Mycolicibacterium sp. 3033]|nr:alpha/beta hydrolase [Mycolicibacterium aurantiacum]